MSRTVARQLLVQVEPDFLQGLTKRGPLAGLAELMWNAVDAEATTVKVSLIRNELLGVSAVEVADDGHGMTSREATEAFEHLGGSWKHHALRSRNDKRLLHGPNGQGRFFSFGLGDTIEWRTIAEVEAGRRELTVISATASKLRTPEIADPEATTEPSGTRVTIYNVAEAAQSTLLRDTTKQWLTRRFALSLERYPNLAITFAAERIDPTEFQAHRESYAVEAPGIAEPITLDVIEWNWSTTEFERELLLCDENGMALFSIQPSIQAAGFDFTAYVKWAGFRRQEADLPLAGGSLNPFEGVLGPVREKLREHFDLRAAEVRQTAVQRWKNEEVYPYDAEAKTELEKVEREVFDVVATTASSVVNAAGDKVAKKFSLSLLRAAVEQGPSTLKRVFHEVLGLSDAQLADFDDLLQRTTLSSLITLGKLVTDRLDFLEGLHYLLFEPESRRALLERRQLQELLTAEPWIFGEEWSLALSERQLTSVLREHIEILGRSDFVDTETPVVDAGGSSARRVDMLFSLAAELPLPIRKHLVVELKRPDVVLNMEHFGQIANYANAVASDPRFDTLEVQWSFWLVGTQIDPVLAGQANQKGQPPGLASQGENGRIEIWVKSWAQLLDDCKHRLRFLREQLDYRSTDETALDQLHRAHHALVPEPVRRRRKRPSTEQATSAS